MKYTLIILIIAALAITGFVINRDQPKVFDDSELAQYFALRMREEGVSRIGQPIEGFDAELWMRAFSQLRPEDFDGVDALQGEYEFEDGILEFKQSNTMPIHSAAQMISEEGMAELLHNLATRMEVKVESREDVELIISALGPPQAGVGPPGTDPDQDNGIVQSNFGTKIVYGSDASQLSRYRADCRQRNGVFNECGSPCAPDAEVCITVCAYTCEILGSAQGQGTLSGYVHVGPTCPVVRQGQEEECADRDFANALVEIEKRPAFGSTEPSVKYTARTNAKGRFSIQIPAGIYTVTASSGSGGSLPSCESEQVVLRVSATTDIDLSCDSGIR
ncbi:MAG: carboxypeptidase-like regulatory domain-containing protein [Candidatus Harrisonbacteria bacterium]|nr:carboxypeptidase-like regulatory domain-containing protein [Candidatus Harrisonbacteria bacterium]